MKTRSRAGAVFLCLVYAAANVFLPSLAQANLWEERRFAGRRAASSSRGEELLASLPGASPAAPLRISASLPPSLLQNIPREASRRLEPIFAALQSRHGTFRRVFLPTDGRSRGTGPLVLHIQDVHQNAAAQEHIAGAVQDLARAGLAVGVALEAAWGPLDFSPYRAFSHPKAVAGAAEFLLGRNLITGPVKAALTGGGDFPPVVGVDDPALHGANVAAYLRAAPLVEPVKESLRARRAALERRKAAVFNPALAALDRAVSAYGNGSIPLGGYVRALATAAGKAPVPGQVSLFLETLSLESSLDFKKVEADRRALIEVLARKSSPARLDALARAAAGHKAGALGTAGFYRFLADFCGSAGVPLSGYPHMDAYVRYALKADGIDGEALYRDLAALEKAGYARLARGAEESSLTAESRRLMLTEKLAAFSLSPEEWREYAAASGALKVEGLSAFEDFYRHAHARDEAMAGNLLKAFSPGPSKCLVLVTGGHHGPGITERLTRAGHMVVSFTPRIENAGDPAAALTVFAQEKTPLDKIFEGRRLFLGDSPAGPEIPVSTVAAAVWVTRDAAQAPAHFQELKAPVTGTAELLPDGVSMDVQTADGQKKSLGGKFTMDGAGKILGMVHGSYVANRYEWARSLGERLLWGAVAAALWETAVDFGRTFISTWRDLRASRMPRPLEKDFMDRHFPFVYRGGDVEPVDVRYLSEREREAVVAGLARMAALFMRPLSWASLFLITSPLWTGLGLAAMAAGYAGAPLIIGVPFLFSGGMVMYAGSSHVIVNARAILLEKGLMAMSRRRPVDGDDRPVKAGLISRALAQEAEAVRRALRPSLPVTVLADQSGTDLAYLFLSVDPLDVVFVGDYAGVTLAEFRAALTDPAKFMESWLSLEYRRTGPDGIAPAHSYSTPRQKIAAFLRELAALGVDPATIRLSEAEGGALLLRFPWSPRKSGSGLERRSVLLVDGDASSPKEFPPALKTFLNRGIDVYYRRPSSPPLPRPSEKLFPFLSESPAFVGFEYDVSSPLSKPLGGRAIPENDSSRKALDAWWESLGQEFGHVWNPGLARQWLDKILKEATFHFLLVSGRVEPETPLDPADKYAQDLDHIPPFEVSAMPRDLLRRILLINPDLRDMFMGMLRERRWPYTDLNQSGLNDEEGEFLVQLSKGLSDLRGRHSGEEGGIDIFTSTFERIILRLTRLAQWDFFNRLGGVYALSLSFVAGESTRFAQSGAPPWREYRFRHREEDAGEVRSEVEIMPRDILMTRSLVEDAPWDVLARGKGVVLRFHRRNELLLSPAGKRRVNRALIRLLGRLSAVLQEAMSSRDMENLQDRLDVLSNEAPSPLLIWTLAEAVKSLDHFKASKNPMMDSLLALEMCRATVDAAAKALRLATPGQDIPLVSVGPRKVAVDLAALAGPFIPDGGAVARHPLGAAVSAEDLARIDTSAAMLLEGAGEMMGRWINKARDLEVWEKRKKRSLGMSALQSALRHETVRDVLAGGKRGEELRLRVFHQEAPYRVGGVSIGAFSLRRGNGWEVYLSGERESDGGEAYLFLQLFHEFHETFTLPLRLPGAPRERLHGIAVHDEAILAAAPAFQDRGDGSDTRDRFPRYLTFPGLSPLTLREILALDMDGLQRLASNRGEYWALLGEIFKKRVPERWAAARDYTQAVETAARAEVFRRRTRDILEPVTRGWAARQVYDGPEYMENLAMVGALRSLEDGLAVVSLDREALPRWAGAVNDALLNVESHARRVNDRLMEGEPTVRIDVPVVNAIFVHAAVAAAARRLFLAEAARFGLNLGSPGLSLVRVRDPSPEAVRRTHSALMKLLLRKANLYRNDEDLRPGLGRLYDGLLIQSRGVLRGGDRGLHDFFERLSAVAEAESRYRWIGGTVPSGAGLYRACLELVRAGGWRMERPKRHFFPLLQRPPPGGSSSVDIAFWGAQVLVDAVLWPLLGPLPLTLLRGHAGARLLVLREYGVWRLPVRLELDPLFLTGEMWDMLMRLSGFKEVPVDPSIAAAAARATERFQSATKSPLSLVIEVRRPEAGAVPSGDPLDLSKFIWTDHQRPGGPVVVVHSAALAGLSEEEADRFLTLVLSHEFLALKGWAHARIVEAGFTKDHPATKSLDAEGLITLLSSVSLSADRQALLAHIRAHLPDAVIALRNIEHGVKAEMDPFSLLPDLGMAGSLSLYNVEGAEEFDPLWSRIEALSEEMRRLKPSIDDAKRGTLAPERPLEAVERLDALLPALEAIVPDLGRAREVLAADAARRGIDRSVPIEKMGRLGQLLRVLRGCRDFMAGTLASVPVDMRETAKQAAEGRAMVVLTLDGSGPWTVRGDPFHLRVALDNLLDNAEFYAKEHSQESARVKLRLSKEPGRIVLEISDNGPGIPRSRLGSIFNLNETTRPGGTGLGTAQAWRTAELSRGLLMVESLTEDGARGLAPLKEAAGGAWFWTDSVTWGEKLALERLLPEFEAVFGEMTAVLDETAAGSLSPAASKLRLSFIKKRIAEGPLGRVEDKFRHVPATLSAALDFLWMAPNRERVDPLRRKVESALNAFRLVAEGGRTTPGSTFSLHLPTDRPDLRGSLEVAGSLVPDGGVAAPLMEALGLKGDSPDVVVLPAAPAKKGAVPRGLAILRKELGADAVRLFRAEDGRVLGVVPVDLKGVGILDFSPYNFPIPALSDPSAPEKWAEIGKRYMDERDSLKGRASPLLLAGEMESQSPYVLLRLPRFPGLLEAYEFPIGRGLPELQGFFARLVGDSRFHEALLPVLPTVYSPATGNHVLSDTGYYARLWADARNSVGRDVLVLGPGAGTDPWVVSRGRPASLTVVGLNPLEVLNTRLTAGLTGFSVDAREGDNLKALKKLEGLKDARFDRVYWNMPSLSPLSVSKDKLLTGIWDHRPAAVLKEFLRDLPSRLKPGGAALVWNDGDEVKKIMAALPPPLKAEDLGMNVYRLTLSTEVKKRDVSRNGLKYLSWVLLGGGILAGRTEAAVAEPLFPARGALLSGAAEWMERLQLAVSHPFFWPMVGVALVVLVSITVNLVVVVSRKKSLGDSRKEMPNNGVAPQRWEKDLDRFLPATLNFQVEASLAGLPGALEDREALAAAPKTWANFRSHRSVPWTVPEALSSERLKEAFAGDEKALSGAIRAVARSWMRGASLRAEAGDLSAGGKRRDFEFLLRVIARAWNIPPAFLEGAKPSIHRFLHETLDASLAHSIWLARLGRVAAGDTGGNALWTYNVTGLLAAQRERDLSPEDALLLAVLREDGARWVANDERWVHEVAFVADDARTGAEIRAEVIARYGLSQALSGAGSFTTADTPGLRGEDGLLKIAVVVDTLRRGGSVIGRLRMLSAVRVDLRGLEDILASDLLRMARRWRDALDAYRWVLISA